MIKVGLSGNRYSGKDRVSTLFSQISIPVFEADIVMKFILMHNYELQNDIMNKIGYEFFNSEGQLDFDKVKNQKVFGDIIKIIEKDIFDAYKRFSKKHKESIYTIFHSSCLFEAGWNKQMHYNIIVHCSTNDRLERCKYLTNKTVSSIYQLAQSEMADIDKSKYSDFVVHNYNEVNLTLGDCLKQVNQIDQQIIDEYLKAEMSQKLIMI
jgi:dephospho-CoA kinase